MHVSNCGGDVIAWAEQFYLFLSAKMPQSQPVHPTINPYGMGANPPMYQTYNSNSTSPNFTINPTP